MASSRKHISVSIGVQKITNKSLLDTLESRLKSYCEDEKGITLDYECGSLETPAWGNKVPFELLNGIENIITILEIFVPKTERRKYVGTEIARIICEVFGKTSIIFADGGANKKEFPELKYTLDKAETSIGKKLIPVEEVKQYQKDFFNANGFADISQLLDIENKYIFASYLGALAVQYMECYVVSYGKLPFRLTNKIYAEAFMNYLALSDNPTVHIFPLCVMSEHYDLKKLDVEFDAEALREKYINRSWYSEYTYEGEPDGVVTSAAYSREFLRKIGGLEVEVLQSEPPIISYPSIYFEVDDNNVVRCTGEDDDLPEKYYYEANEHEFIRLVGYALDTDGVWRRRVWYYDTQDFDIYDTVIPGTDAPLAYVGYLASVLEAEDEETEAEIMVARKEQVKMDKKALEGTEEDDASVEEIDDEDED